jgi:hypothetical protein
MGTSDQDVRFLKCEFEAWRGIDCNGDNEQLAGTSYAFTTGQIIMPTDPQTNNTTRTAYMHSFDSFKSLPSGGDYAIGQQERQCEVSIHN